MNISQLKNFDPRGGMDLEQLISGDVQLKALANGYDSRKLEIPEWIGEKISMIDHEINVQARVEREATLKKLKARRAALATTEERRSRLDAEIATLEQQV